MTFRIFLLLLTISIATVSCSRDASLEKIPDVSFQLEKYLNNAIRELSEQLEEDVSIDRLIKLGVLLEQKGWPSESQRWASFSAPYSLENAHLGTLLGQYYLTIDDLFKAQEYAALANRMGWQSVEFYKLQAEISTKKRAYPQAIDYVNRAILINQSDYYLYQTKADIYLTLGDTISGINFLQKSLSLQPRLKDISDRLITIHLLRKENQAAIDLIRKMQEYYPGDAQLVLREIDYFLSENMIDSAKSRLVEKVVNNEKVSPVLSMRLADLYQQQGLMDSSLLISDKLLSMDSTLIGEYIRQGQLYDQKNFLNRSLESYNKALALDSTSDIALSGRLKVWRKLAYLRELREAKEQLPRFQSLTPKKN
ncbi:MAG: hypothetical protein AAGC47_11495 [Bacteroidota bacterium]